MATTTNYGWTTPDDTALVKDGAAAIRTLGSSVDSTVFANASAGIPKTIVDAKGDLIAATAADTVSRIGVGANDTVLTADSTTATGLKWATPVSGSPTSATATVATNQTTTSTTYTDLTTVGPTVTVTTGTKALVLISSFINNNGAPVSNFQVSYAVSGASTVAASDTVALIAAVDGSTGAGKHRATSASLVTLTAGSNTFTAKYRVTGGTGAFFDRNIIVINLG